MERLLTYVLGRQWAIIPEIAGVMAEIFVRRLAAERLSPEEVEARIGDLSAAAATRRQEVAGTTDTGAVAVLPIYGLISHRARLVGDVSSPASTSAEQLAEDIRARAADPRVGAILLDVDSPGGAVDGITEAAAEIRRARATKPVVAVANAMAGSAAYCLAAQATQLVVTPSGQVGSIGVYTLHEEISKKLEAEGVRRTLIAAGRYKVEGNPFEPLSAEAHAAVQAKVDTVYDMFVADVAKGRGVAPATVREGYGEGRLLLARAALAEGMVDRIATLDQVLRELTAGEYPDPRSRVAAAAGPTLASGSPASLVALDLARRRRRVQRHSDAT